MKKIIITTLLIIGFLISSNVFAGGGCYQDPIVKVNYMAKITTGANLRDRPCMAGTNVITTIPVGEVVQVIADNDGWIQIKRSNGTTGRVGTWLTTKINQEPPAVPVNTDNLYTSSETSNSKTYMPTTNDKALLEKIYTKIDEISEKNPDKLETLSEAIEKIKSKYKYKERIYYILTEIEDYINEKIDMIDINSIFDI